MSIAGSPFTLHQQVCHAHHLLCSSLHLFPRCDWSIILSLTISVFPSCSKLCTLITSTYRITIRNSHSVSAVGAGNGNDFFSPTLRVLFFHDLGPWRDDQVVSCIYRLFYFSPFCFCRSIFFLFHCITLHPIILCYYEQLTIIVHIFILSHHRSFS